MAEWGPVAVVGGSHQGAADDAWRVLVVEDEYYIADEIRQELEARGTQIVGPAPTIERALALIAGDATIGIAVLDVKLGNDMVWPVIDALRRRGVPYVFVTGYGDTDIPAVYRKAPLFRKPMETTAVVKALLERRNPAPPNLG